MDGCQWPRRGRVMGRECEDCRGATPAKPPFERRWRGAPEDRMPRRGITTAVPHRSKNDVSGPAEFSAFARSYAPPAHSIFRPFGAPSFKGRLADVSLRDIFIMRRSRHLSSLSVAIAIPLPFLYVRQSFRAQRSAPRSAAPVNGGLL